MIKFQLRFTKQIQVPMDALPKKQTKYVTKPQSTVSSGAHECCCNGKGQRSHRGLARHDTGNNNRNDIKHQTSGVSSRLTVGAVSAARATTSPSIVFPPASTTPESDDGLGLEPGVAISPLPLLLLLSLLLAQGHDSVRRREESSTAKPRCTIFALRDSCSRAPMWALAVGTEGNAGGGDKAGYHALTVTKG